MTRIKLAAFIALIITAACSIQALKIGQSKKAGARPKRSATGSTFFATLKQEVEAIDKTTKAKKTLVPDEMANYLTLARAFEQVNKDLFDKVQQKDTASKVEPISFLSFEFQRQMLGELQPILTPLKLGLTKAYATAVSQDALKAKELNKYRGIMETLINKAESSLKQINDKIEKTKTATSFSSIKQLYNEVSNWGHFDELTLGADNLLLKLNNDQLKSLFQQKKTLLLSLAKNLKGISPQTPDVQELAILVNGKIIETDLHLNEKTLPKAAPAPAPQPTPTPAPTAAPQPAPAPAQPPLSQEELTKKLLEFHVELDALSKQAGN